MFLAIEDLTAFATIDQAKATAMIEDAEAMALMAAPCLSGTLTDQQRKAAKAILRAAVLRWNDQGTGALQQESIGPYGSTYDTRQQRRGLFWPSEIEALQTVCATTSSRMVFTVQTLPTCSPHLPWCNLAFGATYCSCGADIAGHPIYEDPESA